MKTTASVALLSLIGSISALPSANRLYVRDCKPGFLVCQGDGQFGLCNIDSTAIFMKVAEGTKCVCSDSDCTIAAVDGDAPVPQPSQGAPAPAPTSQAPSSAQPESQPEPAPETAQPAPPASQEPAPQSPPAPAATTESAAPAATTPAGIFKEVPTDSGAKAVAPKPSAAEPSTSEPEPSETSAPESGSGSGSSSGGINLGSAKSYIKTFLGNGDTSSGWPGEDQWASFDSMWDENLKNVISKSCTSFGQANNSPSESADVKSAIESVAQSSGVDARFILAITMQESNGCVRAPTTNYGVNNPGMMQSHNGDNSCYNVNPCPKDKIVGMIKDGTMGTSSGDGLKQILAQVGGSGVSQFYKAARVYNSGSIAPDGLLQSGIATHCYASDIANRLLGWSQGPASCNLS